MDHQPNNGSSSGSLPGVYASGSPAGSRGYVNGNNTMHAAGSSAVSSGFSLTRAPVNPSIVQDLESAFSRLCSDSNGGVVNENHYDEYGRMMLPAARNPNNPYEVAGREQSLAPFYGPSSSSSSSSYYQQDPFFSDFNSGLQNGYGSSSPSLFFADDQLSNLRSINDHQSSVTLQSSLYNACNQSPGRRFVTNSGNQFGNESGFLETGRFNDGRRNGRKSISIGGSSSSMQRGLCDYKKPWTASMPCKFSDLRGQLVRYSMDQNGCRLLQNMFEKMGREEYDILFDEVIGAISQLMMDRHGNFIFQKLVQVCSVDQITRIVAAITLNQLHLAHICLNPDGTRAVQKLLLYLTTQEQVTMMISAISHEVFRLSEHENAHHVIVYCVKNFPCYLNQVFMDNMARFSYELSTSQSGCCVVQSCVYYSQGAPRDRLVHEIISVAQLLSEDQYGNYVVQCLLGQEDRVIRMRVWESLKGTFMSLSLNKFGSNVVEACLEKSDRRHVDLIIQEMLDHPQISSLFSDQFGNYVTQFALSASEGAVHEALVRRIQKDAPSLQSNQYGKMTLSWFDPRKRRRWMRNRARNGQFHP